MKKFLATLIFLVVVAGVVAYWQGYLEIGLDIQSVKQDLTGTLQGSEPEAKSISKSTPAPNSALHPAPPQPALRYGDEKRYMLELINAEREKAGVPPVILGNNGAAQLHAEASLENCFSSHWGVDGLKPYMRYSLAGGYQSNGENVAGLSYCITGSDWYRELDGIESEIRETMEGWMDSPGHRDNILDRWHKKVNIGLAWDRFNLVAVQHFEGDYVEYDPLPAIQDGVLTIAGQTRNGLRFTSDEDFGAQILYDPPPHRLTRGQVALTYCYNPGLLIAGLRPPLTGGWYYSEHTVTATYQTCPNPYEVSPDSPAPQSPEEAHESWQQVYDASQDSPEQSTTIPWITASEWTTIGQTFTVTADLSGVLLEHGDGVYTVALWGIVDGEDVVISEYSIFHGVMPPDTYSVNP